MNTEKLKGFAKDLRSPDVLSDFNFRMDKIEGCVIGFVLKLGYSFDTLSFGETGDTLSNAFMARHWVVASAWSKIDNTRIGAAKRIEYLLENGVPENVLEQLAGQVPPSYDLSHL